MKFVKTAVDTALSITFYIMGGIGLAFFGLGVSLLIAAGIALQKLEEWHDSP